jgi:hypothetical protein
MTACTRSARFSFIKARPTCVFTVASLMISSWTRPGLAHQGNMTAFRADFGRVAPHGYPTGPVSRALGRASAPFPFRACGKSNGL